MLEQYLEIKEGVPGFILFYQLGDFFEMFFEDALLASRILEITLTSRHKGDQNQVPMCGVPIQAAPGYVARLVEKGYKVIRLPCANRWKTPPRPRGSFVGK